MEQQVITQRSDLLIRRMILSPGEAMPWHVDTCHRFTVIVQGTRLAIEYRDTGEVTEFDVAPGLAEWDAPEARVHRAINRGSGLYEEVVTFYRSNADIDPQPAG